MAVVAAILLPIINVVQGLLFLLILLIIVRSLLTFFPSVSPWHPAVRALAAVTDPVLRPMRRLPLVVGDFDLSPAVAILAIYVVRQIIQNLTVVLFSQASP